MFDPDYPIESLVPAAYNPRRIDDDSFAALVESIRTLGVLRPVIAKTDGTLMAGHQRSRAMRAAGLTRCPAFILDGVTVSAEMRFNQLHNAADLERTPIRIDLPPGEAGRWTEVSPDRIQQSGDRCNSPQRNEVMRLMTSYGDWSNAVATEGGRVLVGHLYASAARILGRPLLVRYVPGRDADAVETRFGRRYGTFSYGHLPKTTWIQTMAQRRRKDSYRSRLYDNDVIKSLKTGDRVLDFGCGYGDYVGKLRGTGVDIMGVEFYRKVPGKHEIDLKAVRGMADSLFAALKDRGRFDVVVCDSVLNSIDSDQAEKDVLATVNALCKPGGLIFASGRCRRFAERLADSKSWVSTRHNTLIFCDDDGFSAMHQGDGWVFQRYHRPDQAKLLARRFIGPDSRLIDYDGSWCIRGVKQVELSRDEASEAIRREFNLPLPDGRSFGLSDRAIESWEAALSREAQNKAV